jgi:HlyD family secretion protein
MKALRRGATHADRAPEFAPRLLRMQTVPPSPLPGRVLHALLLLLAAALTWASLAPLDIIAVAQGRVVPLNYLQIVQPSESGIVRELLVREGDVVSKGQVLARMDARATTADLRQLHNDLGLKGLQLRRIDGELAGKPMTRLPGDAPALYAQVEAQSGARRQAYLDSLAAERAVLAKARQDLHSGQALEVKLRRTVPIYSEQEQVYDRLARDGFAGRMLQLEKQRERIEKEQDLKAQEHNIASLMASIEQSERRAAQITSAYRQQLHNERVEAEAQQHRMQQELDKLSQRYELLELRAPQDGVVKDLATHTVGSVVSPGTVVMTLVPLNDPMQCEIWVSNEDAGLVRPGQKVKIKLAAYPFQKFGLAEGEVRHVSPDASDLPEAANREKKRELGHMLPPTGYRTLVALHSPVLEAGGAQFRIAPGMQLAAEINLGTRTVMRYLLSPVQKTLHEAGRER